MAAFSGEKRTGDYRPILELPYTPLDTLLEIVAGLGILGHVVILLKWWPVLPARVPTHFGLAGLPDAWGGKESLFILPAVGLFIYLLLTILSRFPHVYNYMCKLHEKNVEQQYRLARSLLLWMKTEIVWLFAYIEWMTILSALEQRLGLGAAFLPVTMAVIFGTIGIYIWLALRYR